MTEKGEEMGGGGEGEREREHVELWNRFMVGRKKGVGGGGGSDLGKGRRLPVLNIPRDEWENQSTRGKNPLVRCSEKPMIFRIRIFIVPVQVYNS